MTPERYQQVAEAAKAETLDVIDWTLTEFGIDGPKDDGSPVISGIVAALVERMLSCGVPLETVRADILGLIDAMGPQISFIVECERAGIQGGTA
jgi:hypothetical protein